MTPSEYTACASMSKSVQRRGPDKSLACVHPFFFLAFHRLAFNDLSVMGDQPFVFYEDDAVYHMVANGEIYNHVALVKEYGLMPRSSNDCEVIYHLYRHLEGDVDALLDALDGEFVFIIIRTASGRPVEVVAARDPYGVRPLFYRVSSDRIYFSSLTMEDGCTPFPPGASLVAREGKYNITKKTTGLWCEKDMTYQAVSGALVDAVRKRVSGERPLACLLSGGLDSSLVCGILVNVLGVKDLHTFTIGMEGGTDIAYAKDVARHLGTTHHTILFTVEEGIAAIDDVIRATGTWDITTIRASVGQFLLARHISENTPFRAILNGDGADEACMGYAYWNNAPTPLDAHEESMRRLEEIYLYDGLRVDRTLGWFGLEARLPFLDREFVGVYTSIPATARIPTPTRMEKHLLRKSFAVMYPGILPENVLWRRKEAFSDGVSPPNDSWFRIIQARMDAIISDEEYRDAPHLFPEDAPTKEAYYYQKKFLEFFGRENTGVIPRYWMPRWSGDLREPSARVLPCYNNAIIDG